MAKNRIHILLLIMLVARLFSSCSVDDYRDMSCESVRLDYRYVRQDFDEYEGHVRHLRHFLFDQQGNFIREEMQDPASSQTLRLRQLPWGEYTMLTVGNATDNTQLTPQTVNLQAMLLSLPDVQPDGSRANGDQLFWNACEFVAEKNKERRYVCDLSNIHCHLFVRVFWNNRPPRNGTYTMQLEGVPVENTLDPRREHQRVIIFDNEGVKGNTSTQNRAVHSFPGLIGELGTHIVQAPLYNFELQGEFITLRYTNSHIPVFRLYFGPEAITKPIDLAKAFAAWGWRPDQHLEQVYRIQMEIFDDGKVVVEQWADTAVLDWVNGGQIGTGV